MSNFYQRTRLEDPSRRVGAEECDGGLRISGTRAFLCIAGKAAAAACTFVRTDESARDAVGCQFFTYYYDKQKRRAGSDIVALARSRFYFQIYAPSIIPRECGNIFDKYA